MITKLRRRSLNKNSNLLKEVNIPKLLKRIYIQRGIQVSDELERSTCSLLSYNLLSNINKAVDLLVTTIVKQFRLIIVGDFDVDGATSTALTVIALRQMGIKNIDFLIPNRFYDDHGLSPEIVERLSKNGAQIIMTVDNGISSFEGVTVAHKKNIPVIITDHHIPGDILPDADAIVNPNLRDCVFSSKSIAGVGVAFYVMLALRSRLNNINWFTKQNINTPNLANLLDLVALGTIADAVTLDTNNRILVYQGLSRIRAGFCRPGIRALIEVANRNIYWLCAKDLGFVLSPRLNAAGRLDDMSISVTLLLTNNILYARSIAKKLNNLNQNRRKIGQFMENEALTLCQALINKKQKISFGLVIYNKNWHLGILGILASRMRDYFHRPVIAFAPISDGILKGSGRSISGLHICHLLKQINILYPGLILKFGGHAMAAGLILKQIQFKKFCDYFDKIVNNLINSSMIENVIWSDGELSSQELSLNTAKLLRNSGPWGQGFPDPIFDGKFIIINQWLVGKKHLKLLLKPLNGGPVLNGIAFNINLYLWPNNNVHIARLAYKLDINEFHDNYSLQLLIQYIWPL